MKTRLILIALALLGGLLIAPFGMTPAAHAAAGAAAAPAAGPAPLSPTPVALLMVHGFADTCAGAFGDTAATHSGNGPSGPNDVPTVSYFRDHGWHDSIDVVGYYAGDETGCTNDAWSDSNALSKCTPLNPNSYTTWNTPIEYLGCELAWYIYDTYTYHGWSVDILAHSMGGLVVRAAIGYSEPGSPYSADYPPPLGVTHVATIATPHGGLSGQYLVDAQNQYPGTLPNNVQYEIAEMTQGSGFLRQLPADPQGALGTWWGLMGSSVGAACLSTGAGLISCLAQNDAIGGPDEVSFHDGDSVIQASSTMAMDADMKVLYGHVEGVMPTSDPTNGTVGTVIVDNYTAGTGLAGEYVHEYGCPTFDGHPFCGSPPYYLNDGTSGTTKAWVCTGSCDSADVNGPDAFDDLNVSGAPVSTPYSLAEMATNMVPAPATPPVYDVPGFGAFYAGWQARGGAGGTLGPAVGWWSQEGNGPESEQDFTSGSLYAFGVDSSSPGTDDACTGCYAVYGSANADYKSLGGPLGFLGIPQGDEGPDGNGGEVVKFANTNCVNQPVTGQGAAIYAGPGLPAAEIQGCIYAAYQKSFGGPAGVLGYPISNETTITGGKVNYFSGPDETGCNYPYPVINGATARGAIYWDTTTPTATLYAVEGCAFAAFHHWGEITGPLGYPVSSQTSNGTELLQLFQGGTVFDVNGTVTNSLWVAGHAAHAGDDYPQETFGQFGHQYEGTDAWMEYYGQCDSFAAWKVYENLAGAAAQHPSIVPAPGWTPSNASISPVNQETMGPGRGWGNADAWAGYFSGLGYAVNDTPVPGAIAYWANGAADSQDGLPANANGLPGSPTGHVGYVTDVYPDGSITVEMYNMRENGEYSVVHMAYKQGYTDNSFGQPNYSVPWPNSFIHVADGPSGAASPAEPGNGVVTAGYPSQVKVIGPGSSSSQFSLGNVWYLRAGHGELGNEEWTHTNGASAVSTATYTPSGLAANVCYRIDAFVPDNYADNPVAVYTVSDVNGSHLAAVNENAFTSSWADLGVYETNGSGQMTVRLDDRGTTGLYVAADAMRFWRNAFTNQFAPMGGFTSTSSGQIQVTLTNMGPSGQYVAADAVAFTPDPLCEGPVGTGFGPVYPSLAFGPGSSPGNFVTTSPWYLRLGHGYAYHELWTYDNGSTADSTATWTFKGSASTCYSVQAYVPDNYADNPQAHYSVSTSLVSDPALTLDQASYTNQFVWLASITTGSDGIVQVRLTDQGPAKDSSGNALYTAADAIEFIPNGPNC